MPDATLAELDLITLGDVVEGIRSGTWRADIEELRAPPATTSPGPDPEPTLPGVLWFGRFLEPGAAAPLDPSGLIGLSVGDLTAARRQELRGRLAEDPHVFTFFDNPALTGLEVVLRCDPSRPHFEVFSLARRYLARTFEVKIDASTQPAARVGAVSYDREIWINYSALPLPDPSAALELPAPGDDRAPEIDAPLPVAESTENPPGVSTLPAAQNETPGVPAAYYNPVTKGYLIENNRGAWIAITEGQLKRRLKPFLRSKPVDGEPLSELDQHLVHLMTERDINYAGPLAGADPGLINFMNRRVLVTNGPVVIQPVPGDWSVLRTLLEGLLIGDVDQTEILYGWLKVAREALLQRKLRPGQLLVLAGPAGCGKSLLQNLVTLLLGGRAAKPYGWMTGSTTFNSELFESEHLMIEDEIASTDIRARRAFGAMIKAVTVNVNAECHPKHFPKLTLAPFWRVTLTLNDEMENLAILPILDESLEDKVILLRAFKNPLPMPTVTMEERAAFWNALVSQLPAFCSFLEQWEIPADLVDGRFGVTHYHHPDLLRAIDELAPETRLWQLIETAVLKLTSTWSGSSTELTHKLVGNYGPEAQEARKLLSYPTACGRYLARLEKSRPDSVSSKRSRHGTVWTVQRGPDWSGPELGSAEGFEEKPY